MVLENQMTAEEFLDYADKHPDKRFDFVDGEIVEVSPKRIHGRSQTIFATALENFTQSNPIGVVHTEVLHVLDGKKFMPDVSVNAADLQGDYFTTPPLLAIEIRSDTQTEASQRRKAREYIKRGTPMVILVFPGKSVEVYRQGQTKPLVLTVDDTIDGDDVLPGFKLPVRDIFPK